jgi:hypothetical protein
VVNYARREHIETGKKYDSVFPVLRFLNNGALVERFGAANGAT